jgi:hypothetical protein
LTEARGAAGLVDALFLEADWGVIGWSFVATFFKNGEFLQKRITGAGGRNLRALLKARVFHIIHQISKSSVEELKDRL